MEADLATYKILMYWSYYCSLVACLYRRLQNGMVAPTVPGAATIVMMHEKIPIADPLQVKGILLIT